MSDRKTWLSGGSPLALLILLMGVHPADAAKVAWRKDFRRAAQESKRVKKPMLVGITASWCGYCHKMMNETFTNERVVRHVNGCFVPVAVDADSHRKLVDAIGIEGLPTTVIISPDLKILKRITGYQTAGELDRYLESVCRAQKHGIREGHVCRPHATTEPAFTFGQRWLVTLCDLQKLHHGYARTD